MIRTVAALVLGMAAATTASADTYGRHERVRVLASLGIEIDSRLDPAAATSTLRAFDVKYFNRQGDMWVRFIIDNGSALPGSRLTVDRSEAQRLRSQHLHRAADSGCGGSRQARGGRCSARVHDRTGLRGQRHGAAGFRQRQ